VVNRLGLVAQVTIHIAQPEGIGTGQPYIVDPVHAVSMLQEALETLGEATEKMERRGKAEEEREQRAVLLGRRQTLHLEEGVLEGGHRFGMRIVAGGRVPRAAGIKVCFQTS